MKTLERLTVEGLLLGCSMIVLMAMVFSIAPTDVASVTAVAVVAVGAALSARR
jgi:hypothetical protein